MKDHSYSKLQAYQDNFYIYFNLIGVLIFWRTPFYTIKIMRIYIIFSLLFITLTISFSCNTKYEKYIKPTDKEPSVLLDTIIQFYTSKLDSCSTYLNMMDVSKNLDENRAIFLEARKWYKRAEPLILKFDHENYKTINGPNLLKVEAEAPTEIKKIKPKSFQVLEELLFSTDSIDRKALQHQLIFLKSRIPFMAHNHIFSNQTDRHLLEALQQTIVNIATKGITGFDSPVLAHSLQEAVYNYETLEELIDMYQAAFKSEKLHKNWKLEINKTKEDLSKGNFDDFDRYAFIKNHTNPQLKLIVETTKDWDIVLSKSSAINPMADNLFDSTFFNMSSFSEPHTPEITPGIIDLGKTLFYDKSLSNQGSMSCASCHNSALAFTDGFTKAMGKDNIELQRNTPTLSYAAFQRSFFHDGRSSSLESQIINVVNNVNEFHINLEILENKVKSDSSYLKQFNEFYDGKVSSRNVRNAIANYIRSLAPFNSKFDRNMQHKEKTLTKSEIKGFNLFMGKAACATCHFPPTFNGTVPPKYLETELENLGVPKYADFAHPNQKIDEDAGAFFPFKVAEKRSFFKTPTVRNAAVTAPYMHNGVYTTLEQVMDFYNKGGGTGLGLKNEYQTLPFDNLNLTKQEIKDIIAFIHTLTDNSDEY